MDDRILDGIGWALVLSLGLWFGGLLGLWMVLGV